LAKKAQKKKTSSKKKTYNQGKREAVSVLMVAVGLFLGVSLYSDAVGVLGKYISNFIFALFGVAAYVLPAVIIVASIVSIVKSKEAVHPAPVILSVLACLLILTMIHIAIRPQIENIGVLEYYRDAYWIGETARQGGGLLGALIAYPALILIGQTGAYIFFSAGIIAILLIVTKLSLRKADAEMIEVC